MLKYIWCVFNSHFETESKIQSAYDTQWVHRPCVRSFSYTDLFFFLPFNFFTNQQPKHSLSSHFYFTKNKRCWSIYYLKWCFRTSGHIWKRLREMKIEIMLFFEVNKKNKTFSRIRIETMKKTQFLNPVHHWIDVTGIGRALHMQFFEKCTHFIH